MLLSFFKTSVHSNSFGSPTIGICMESFWYKPIKCHCKGMQNYRKAALFFFRAEDDDCDTQKNGIMKLQTTTQQARKQNNKIPQLPQSSINLCTNSSFSPSFQFLHDTGRHTVLWEDAVRLWSINDCEALGYTLDSLWIHIPKKEFSPQYAGTLNRSTVSPYTTD